MNSIHTLLGKQLFSENLSVLKSVWQLLCGNWFGLGRSTVCTVVLDTCHAIQKLLPRYVYIPKDERLRDIVEGFDACWGFPQTAGAIDGTHLPILHPSGDSGSDYFNRKS